jgi:hypothetical protein
VLWLRGILGSGKISFVSTVVDDYMMQKQHGVSAAPVLYYYCGDVQGKSGTCDPRDIMRSLLRQLSVKNEETHEIVEQIHLEFKRREAYSTIGMSLVDKLEPHECTHWMKELLHDCATVIIIDAIDEIQVANRHLLLKELIRL